MRILLIKPKQIGDSLVLTPTIVAIRQAHPEAEIWVVVRRGCEGILAGCPEIARILTVAAVEKRDRRAADFWLGLKTIGQIATTRFDFAFELGDGTRGRNLARIAAARKRVSVQPDEAWALEAARKAGCAISTFDWHARHRVEKDFYTVSEFLPLPEPAPPMRFDESARKPWAPAGALTGFCVVQVGSRQGYNRWHREGWRDVCRAMLDRFAHVVVTCGPVDYEREEAAWLCEQLGPRLLSTDGANGMAPRPREALCRPQHRGDASRRGLWLPCRHAVRPVDRGSLASVARAIPHRDESRLRARRRCKGALPAGEEADDGGDPRCGRDQGLQRVDPRKQKVAALVRAWIRPIHRRGTCPYDGGYEQRPAAPYSRFVPR
jgi:heptosyltransferase-3